MDLFSSKKEEKKPLVTEKITKMRTQGYTNDQILQALQGEGHSSADIMDAMNQLEVKSAVIGSSEQTLPPVAPPSKPMTFGRISGRGGLTIDDVQAIAEEIINEKWNELVESVNKIVDWKEKIEGDITAMQERMNQVNLNLQTVQKSIVDKMDEYDGKLRNASADVKALTKVFQKVLPGFIENVSELSRIVEIISKKITPKEAEEVAEKAAEISRGKERTEEIFGEAEGTEEEKEEEEKGMSIEDIE